MYRDKTKIVKIGDRVIGGGNPVLIQSMTNTKTEDVGATVAQIKALTVAGCDIIRCAVPTMEAALALKEIKKQITIPLVADIHFDYRLAIAAMKTGLTKSGSIRAISDRLTGSRLSWMWQRSVISQSVSASTVVLWKKILLKNMDM